MRKRVNPSSDSSRLPVDSLANVGPLTESAFTVHERERRFNGGEHCYLGSWAAQALRELWEAHNLDPMDAFFGSHFSLYTPQGASPEFTRPVKDMIKLFINDESGPLVPCRSMSSGHLPWGYLVGLAADVLGAPPDLSQELKRAKTELSDVVAIFHEELMSNFTLELNLQLVLAGAASCTDHVHYIQLALRNYSHFAGDNLLFYLAHHLVAVTHAAKAAVETDSNRVAHLFTMALLSEAFAAHFLTDMFSAAHGRVPRWAFINKVYKDYPHRADYISRLLHQRDGHGGIVLQNARGHTWYSYGDGQLLKATGVCSFNESLVPPWSVGLEPIVFFSLLQIDPTVQLQPKDLAASLVFVSLCDVLRHLAKGFTIDGAAQGSLDSRGLLGFILERTPFAPSSPMMTEQKRAELAASLGFDFHKMDMRSRLEDILSLYDEHQDIDWVVRKHLCHNFCSLSEFRREFVEPELSLLAAADWGAIQSIHLESDLAGSPPRLLNVPTLLRESEQFPSTTVDRPYDPDVGSLPDAWRQALPQQLADAFTNERGVFWIADFLA